MKTGAVVLWVALWIAVPAAPSLGADAPAVSVTTVRVSTIEEISNQPISRAHVALESDTRSYDGYTDGAGIVTFARVQPGEYHITVQDPDYRFKDRVLTVSGTGESVRVFGTRSRLRAIANVQSRNASAVKSAQRVSNDPHTLIGGSVGAAIPSLSSLGPSQDGSFLIHGHGASSTNATLNGGAIFPNGAGTQLGLLGSDVFESGQVDPGGTAGGPDGTLALRTFDPTIDWQGILQSRAATFGSTAYGFNARGTSGRVGISFVHSDVHLSDPLEGRYYADTSGAFYQHRSLASSRGETATLRYGFDANHVIWLDFGEVSYAAPLTCRTFTGRLPCGYGPGNANSESLRYVQLRDQLTLERLSLETHVFRSNDQTSFAYGNETFFGRSIGFTSGTATSRTGYSATMSYLATPHRSVSLSASGSTDRSRSIGLYSNADYHYPPTTNTLSSLHLDVPMAETRKASLAASVGSERSGSSSGVFWGLKGSYRLTPTDQLGIDGSLGRLSKVLFGSGLSSPENLTYDCAGGRALGFGPGDATQGGAKTEQYRLTYDHAGTRTSASFQVFRDIDHQGPVSAIVSAMALPSAFPPNYLSSVNADASLTCGRGSNLAFGDIFFRVQGIADRTVTDEADLSLTSNLGEKARLDVQYSLVYARAHGLSPILALDPNVREGQLLPGIPTHRLSTSLRYASSKSTTLLAALNYTGADNSTQRTAFSTVDIGARIRAPSGDFVIGVQNVFNAGAGDFGRFAPFPYLTQPSAPRTISFRYRLALGQQNIDKTQPLSAPLFPNSNQIVFAANSFEKPTANALMPQTTVPTCGPEHLASAKAILAAIASYRDYVESELRTGSARTIESRRAAGVNLSYIAMPANYAIRIALPRSVKEAGPFLRCAALHMGDYATAQQMKLYVPGWRQRYGDSIWVLYYAPQAGLYFPPNGMDETSVNDTKRTPFPDTRPLRDIHIDAASCPNTYQSAAASALIDLKNYIEAFYAGTRPGVPFGFRIAAHTSKNGPWLEIRANDFEFNDALATCLDATVATPKELKARGIGGAMFPSLNYAPGVGFYKADESGSVKF